MKNEIITSNMLPADEGSGRNPNGVVCAANASRFNSQYLSEPLTAFAVGYQDPGPVDELLNFIAPGVEVARRFSFKKGENADYFMSEDDDVRAIGASFKRVEYKGSTAEAKTLNKGLTVRVDHDEVQPVGNWQERYVMRLIRRLKLNDLRRAAPQLLAIDGSPVSKNWGPSGDTDPDSDLLGLLISGADELGVKPNRILMGESAELYRKNKYQTTNTPAAGAHAGFTLQQLAAWLGLSQSGGVMVGDQRYQQTLTTKGKAVANDAVVAFYARDVISDEDPSTLKRFYTPTDQGAYAVYIEEHAKFTDISVEHYSVITTTSPLGVKKYTITNT